MNWVCPGCGHSNQISDINCPYCTSLQPGRAAAGSCPICGKYLAAGVLLCPQCKTNQNINTGSSRASRARAYNAQMNQAGRRQPSWAQRQARRNAPPTRRQRLRNWASNVRANRAQRATARQQARQSRQQAGQQAQQQQQQQMGQQAMMQPYGPFMFGQGRMMSAYNFAKYQMKQHMLEMAILWILAIISAVTFQYLYLAVALLAYSFFIIMPSENSILMQAKRNAGSAWACSICGANPRDKNGQVISAMMGGAPPPCPIHGGQCRIVSYSKMGRTNVGKMITRSMLKVFIIIFLILEFGVVHVQNGALTMILLFALYFWLPLSYYVGRISSATESWFRTLAVAPLIAIAMLGFLSPGDSGVLLSGWSIFISNLPLLALSIIPVTWGLALGFSIQKNSEGRRDFVLVMGIIIFLFVFYSFFGSAAIENIRPEIAMFYLVLAFFMTVPQRKISAESFDIKPMLMIKPEDMGNLYGKMHDAKGTLWPAQASMYWVFIMQSAIPIVFSLTSGGPQELTFIAGSIWLLGALIGAAPGARTTRPYIGVMLLILSILLFSFQFTGTVGTAVFGQWWPSVYAVGANVVVPIKDSFTVIGETMDDYTLMATCYDCWVAEMERRKIEERGKLVQGGTTRAIELESFNAVNYATEEPNLDPALPLVGDVQLKNKGEFDAKNVRVYFGGLKTVDPEQVSAAHPGQGEIDLIDNCTITACSGTISDDTHSCALIGEDTDLYPDDKLYLTFECGNPLIEPPYTEWTTTILRCECAEYGLDTGLLETDYILDDPEWDIIAPDVTGGDLAEGYVESSENLADEGLVDTGGDLVEGGGDLAESIDVRTVPLPDIDYDETLDDELVWKVRSLRTCDDIETQCKDVSYGKKDIARYSRARWMITIPLKYDFEYSVSSSLDVRVMDRALYEDLDEKPEQAESQYSGGPAKLSLWTQIQPLRDDATSYAKITITNTGKGKIKAGAKVSVYFNNPGIDMDVNKVPTSVIGLRDCTITNEKIECYTMKNLGNKDTANMLFKFHSKLDQVQEKTFTMTGNMTYEYQGSSDIQLPIASAPLVQ